MKQSEVAVWDGCCCIPLLHVVLYVGLARAYAFDSEDKSVPGTIPAALTNYVELKKVQHVSTMSQVPAVSNQHRQCEITLLSCLTNPYPLISLVRLNCKVEWVPTVRY